jgi:hypothetical protein
VLSHAQALDRRRTAPERELFGNLRVLARHLPQEQWEALAEGLAVGAAAAVAVAASCDWAWRVLLQRPPLPSVVTWEEAPVGIALGRAARAGCCAVDALSALGLDALENKKINVHRVGLFEPAWQDRYKPVVPAAWCCRWSRSCGRASPSCRSTGRRWVGPKLCCSGEVRTTAILAALLARLVMAPTVRHRAC